jgi:hypothetical protein
MLSAQAQVEKAAGDPLERASRLARHVPRAPSRSIPAINTLSPSAQHSSVGLNVRRRSARSKKYSSLNIAVPSDSEPGETLTDPSASHERNPGRTHVRPSRILFLPHSS